MLLPKLSSLKKNKILILAHKGADIDAIASAGALFFALKKNNSVSIGIPEHISLGAKTFAQKMKIPFEINPLLKDFNLLILVDFNSPDMLGSMEKQVLEFQKKIFVIDHHAKSSERISSPQNTLIDSSRAAAAELVFEWIKKSNLKISKEIATCISAGIIEDSAHFIAADKRTFSIMAECLEKSCKTLREIFLLFRIPFDKSRKIAMLKAAERAEIFEAGDFLIALSNVGAFEADSAGALVHCGADISFVGNSEKGFLKISGRAGHFILHETKIDLAKNVFQPLEKFFEGSSGGHAAAAAFNGKSENTEAALQKCLELSLEFLKTKKPGIEAKKI